MKDGQKLAIFPFLGKPIIQIPPPTKKILCYLTYRYTPSFKFQRTAFTEALFFIEWIQSSNLWSITTYHIRCRHESKDGLTTRGAGVSSVLEMFDKVCQKIAFDKALDQMLLVKE